MKHLKLQVNQKTAPLLARVLAQDYVLALVQLVVLVLAERALVALLVQVVAIVVEDVPRNVEVVADVLVAVEIVIQDV